MRNPTPLTVFYDGNCPVCRREIGHYRRLEREDSPIRWYNVHTNPKALAKYALSLEESLALFHVYDGQGQKYTGVSGFDELWQRLPYFNRIAFILRVPILRPLLDRLYAIFAKRRLSRPSICTSNNKGS